MSSQLIQPVAGRMVAHQEIRIFFTECVRQGGFELRDGDCWKAKQNEPTIKHIWAFKNLTDESVVAFSEMATRSGFYMFPDGIRRLELSLAGLEMLVREYNLQLGDWQKVDIYLLEKYTQRK